MGEGKEYTRRDIFGMGVGAGVAAREALRASDAKADVLPRTPWHQGLQDVTRKTNETGLEHTAAYAKGVSEAVSDFLPVTVVSRSSDGVMHKVDTSRVSRDVLANAHTYVDIHTHPENNLAKIIHAWRGEADSLRLNAIPKELHDRNVSLPPSVSGEITSAAENFYISQDILGWNPRYAEGLVIEARSGDAWYFSSATKEEMRKHFGDAIFQEIGYMHDVQPKIFLNPAMREPYAAALRVHRLFTLDSARYNGNVSVMLASNDPTAKQLFKNMIIATARLGVILRYVPKGDFEKEPPAAGTLYKQSILHTP